MKKQKWSINDVGRALYLKEEGYSIREIAESVHRSGGSVAAQFKRLRKGAWFGGVYIELRD